jgi:hypothetical protein
MHLIVVILSCGAHDNYCGSLIYDPFKLIKDSVKISAKPPCAQWMYNKNNNNRKNVNNTFLSSFFKDKVT